MAIQACVMCVPIVVLQLFPFGHPNKKLCKIELLLYIDFDKRGGGGYFNIIFLKRLYIKFLIISVVQFQTDSTT